MNIIINFVGLIGWFLYTSLFFMLFVPALVVLTIAGLINDIFIVLFHARDYTVTINATILIFLMCYFKVLGSSAINAWDTYVGRPTDKNFNDLWEDCITHIKKGFEEC